MVVVGCQSRLKWMGSHLPGATQPLELQEMVLAPKMGPSSGSGPGPVEGSRVPNLCLEMMKGWTKELAELRSQRDFLPQARLLHLAVLVWRRLRPSGRRTLEHRRALVFGSLPSFLLPARPMPLPAPC